MKMIRDSKKSNLIAGLVSFIGSGIILFFLSSLTVDPVHSNNINLLVKPQYTSLAWGILSLSSALYYFIRSGGKNTSGGYTNPLFAWMLNLAQALPFLGLFLSSIHAAGLIENKLWSDLITVSNNFLQAILILFVVASFFAGLNSFRQFRKKE